MNFEKVYFWKYWRIFFLHFPFKTHRAIFPGFLQCIFANAKCLKKKKKKICSSDVDSTFMLLMFVCCYFSLLPLISSFCSMQPTKYLISPLSLFSPLVLQSLLPFCALAFHVHSTLIYLCQFLFSFSCVYLCNRLCFMIFI